MDSIVFVTIPRSFKYPYLNSQLNTINAIKRYNPDSKIVLYSDDPGVYDFANNNNCIAPSIVKKNGHLPLVNCALIFANDLFPESYVCFINSDILVLTNLNNILETMSIKFKKYMCICYRTEVIVNKVMNDNDFVQILNNTDNLNNGKHTAMDFFLLSPGLVNDIEMPNFSVGRPGWDSWLSCRIRRLSIPLIDISNVVTIAHQDHPQVHDKDSWNVLWKVWTLHGISSFSSLIDSNYKLLSGNNQRLVIKYSLSGFIMGSFVFRLLRAYRRITILLLNRFLQRKE
jgi:hypothetical protein